MPIFIYGTEKGYRMKILLFLVIATAFVLFDQEPCYVSPGKVVESYHRKGMIKMGPYNSYVIIKKADEAQEKLYIERDGKLLLIRR